MHTMVILSLLRSYIQLQNQYRYFCIIKEENLGRQSSLIYIIAEQNNIWLNNGRVTIQKGNTINYSNAAHPKY